MSELLRVEDLSVVFGHGRLANEVLKSPYTQRLWAANLVADPDEQARRREIRTSLNAFAS